MKQKRVVISNQNTPTQKVFYEKVDPLHIINPQNAQNPVYDTTSRQADKDLKKSSGGNGYELMSSVKINRASDNTILSYQERAQGIKSDHYVQLDQNKPVDKRKEQPTCNISQRSKKE